MSARDVQPHEELCIYYGHNLWFPATQSASANDAIVEVDDGWGGLTAVVEDDKVCESSEITNPYADGAQDEVISEDDLPFTRFKLPPEEEDAESIKISTFCSGGRRVISRADSRRSSSMDR